jgi:DUF971 family protein
MRASPFSMRWIPLVALVCLWAGPGHAQEGEGDGVDPLPRLVSRRGETFQLGKRPYPVGTREKWIAEGRVLGKAPEGYLPRKQSLKGSADNRQYLPPIKNQGSEGSCVHWAGSYYVKTASMKRRVPSINVTATSNQCSPRFTYNLSNSGQDNGGYGHEPFELFMRYGVASLSQKPYTAGQYTALPTVADFVEGLHRRSTNYVWLWDWAPSAAQINELKAYLDEGGVAVCAVYAEDTFDAWTANKAPWVGPACTASDMNHMVTVCGYGPGYYLVANSWGTSYGSNGFIYVDASYFEKYFGDVMYPLEGSYEPSTSHARLQIQHARRSDIRSVSFSVNGATVWSNSPLPRTMPKGSGTFATDSRANWALAVDLSAAPWGAANVVTARCMDRVTGTQGSLTNFTIVRNGQGHVSPNTPVVIPDNTGAAASAVVSMQSGAPYLTIQPESTNVSAAASSGRQIAVATTGQWAAARGAASTWITITSGTNTGNGTILFNVASNGGASSRTGAVVVSGGGLSRTCAVVQASAVPGGGSSLGEAVDAPQLDWTTGGSANWIAQAVVSRDGQASAQSGAIGHNQQTWLQAAVAGPGTLRYWWSVSSESGYDHLRFQVNGVEQSGSISGTVAWQQKTVSIPAGAHTLRWLYTKDGSVSSGSDRGWVDQVEWMPAIAELALSPANTNVPSGASSGRTVSVSANVGWTASTNAPWLRITSGQAGTNHGAVTYSTLANAGASARTGMILVAGGGLTRTCRVVQAGSTEASVLRINCGSIAVGEWGADHSWSTVSGGANSTTARIANAGSVPQAVVQHRRYGSRVTYNLDIPDGRYHVRLHFADLFSSGTGKRIFDVRMEGATVLPNYDIIAAAGGAKRAVAELFENVEVTGGLQLEALAKVNTAQFNAIEVWSAGPPPPAVVVNPPAVTVPEGGTAQFGVKLNVAPAGNVTVAVARVSGDADISVTGGASLVFTPANFHVEQMVTLSAAEDADTANGVAVIRCSAAGHAPAEVTATEQDNDVPPVNLKINCGSIAVGEWGADHSWSVVSGGANSTTASIANAGSVPQAVVQHRRYGSRVTYNLDIPDGRYHVRLHFADLFSSGIGKRVFDVRMEGATVLPNYDIIAAAGGAKRAVAVLFENVEVTGGLQLEALAKVNTAQFNAIEVWSAGPPPPAVVVNPPAVTVPEGGTAQFGVKLNVAPAGHVTVAVARVSGDADISVTGGASLVFTPANFHVEQMVTLSAAEDADTANGVAVIRCSAAGHAPAEVTATEQDNDVPPMNLKINCGSIAVGEWGADHSWSVVSGGANSTTASIANAGSVPQAVVQHRRYGSRVTYNLDIPDGRYHVRLHFADLFSSGTGKRVFDVRMEGATVLPNYDIIAAAGGAKRAVAVLFENVEVTGGLQLEALAKVNTAQFNAIEVWSAGSRGALGVQSKASSSGAVGEEARQNPPMWPLAWAKSGEGKWEAAPELVDGDWNTVWTGESGLGPWSVAVDFEEVLDLNGVEVHFAGEPWTVFEAMGSENLETWLDLGLATNRPLPIRALFFQFRPEGRETAPSLREIKWEE